ncbi:hypothetical protein Poly24_31940 [Rosistilla carotiformis]|uniref:DUF3618 domain-containing protein n=1 Tax=Rosistilla carotiformis TaxID=2528017 RepID=A0A518JVC3_9BACT|nr:hypothetical protein [Rosistilla carotiformis]QDV69478.1 hypothetical protein Poly24_31940 [Rosistilla carotiformis]
MANTLATRKQSEAIRHQMQVIRTALPRDVDAARSQAQDLVDWRYHMRKNPWPLLAAASLVGYLVVPAKSVGRTFSSAEPRQAEVPKKSLMGGIAGGLITLAIRSGVSMATRQLSQTLMTRASVFHTGHTNPPFSDNVTS